MGKQLLVISDTALAKIDNKIYGFGPVVREFEYLEKLFDKIIWIGFDNTMNYNSIPFQEIKSDKIELIFLKRLGGENFWDKLLIIFNYPYMIYLIIKNIIKVKFIHTRAPSHPAFIAILLSFLFRNKQWWHKFAGSWDTSILPSFYSLQRNILSKAVHSKVTINGKWKNQPQHCISFENPCLDELDRALGKMVIKQKKLNDGIELCFIGALNEAKGVNLLIEVLNTTDFDKKILKFHFVGNGNLMEKLKINKHYKVPIQIHGQLDKKGLIDIYSKCHFLILPSKSEGFPKVVSEAMNYGCIPIVSNVSSIGQVISDGINGFMIEEFNKNHLLKSIENAIRINEDNHFKIISENYNLASIYTYSQYIKNINGKIFHNI